MKIPKHKTQETVICWKLRIRPPSKLLVPSIRNPLFSQGRIYDKTRDHKQVSLIPWGLALLPKELAEEVFYKEADQVVPSRFASESVPEFHDIHVHTERVWPVDAGVGEVLSTKPRIRMSKRVDRDPGGCDNLHWTAEVLSPKVVSGKKSQPGPDIERH